MRALLLLTLLAFFSHAQAEISQGVGVLGFQAWKASRLEEAKQQLEQVKNEAQAPTKTVDPKAAKAPQESRLQKLNRNDQRLEQAQLNVEIAEELAVNDYFVLYLNQFKDRSAFVEAAQKLNASEAADLMIAYQKHLAAAAAPEASLPGLPTSSNQPGVKAVRR
jgi:hypothetical protein